MPNYHVWTIGCQMNTSDARNVSDELEQLGYAESASMRDADVVILYSCMVRQHAEDKVHSQLGALKKLKSEKPSLRVALAGCIGEVSGWQKRYPFVDFFLEPGQDLSVQDKLTDLIELDELYRIQPDDAVRMGRVSEGVTIQQGCNRSCTYCIVPSTRGGERSRIPFDIQFEVEGLVQRGTREVVLLSQIVERYGRDLRPRVSLAALLAQLNDVRGIERIRFLTSYPGDFGADLIQAVATLPKVCEDINLPVQSGDNDVLRAMKRGYTIEFYTELVQRLRAGIPNLSMSTDIIVGFPGETVAQFENTLKAIENIQWDVIHVAAYSTRAGTAAAEYVDQLPLEEKRQRLHLVEELQKEIQTRRNAVFQDRIVEVLIEGQSKGKWYGRSRNNKLVHVAFPDDLVGRLVDVRITQTSPWSLQGEVQAMKPRSSGLALTALPVLS
ncbi:MAG TPA: tRNA (N6-isopentenyl adenosine(37)-C2)-methylthiotransferase MiaB [Chloroflexota bacterium]|jgi:tRNA-2-methylthio-N6-dimethylallyladenosine synthase|nr:tRNA (N6-isopentenyl adenosine(37)-C2)-methylthiotransferase MiaB [Chloroflexota bacterium]